MCKLRLTAFGFILSLFAVEQSLAQTQMSIGDSYFETTNESPVIDGAQLKPNQKWTQQLASNSWMTQYTSIDGRLSDKPTAVGRFFDDDRDRVFPIFGNLIRKAGYGDALPNPWGVGANIGYIDQPMDIEQISIGISGGPQSPITEVPSFRIKSRDTIVASRVDLWFLPFVNIYGIFGEATGSAVGEVTVNGVSGLTPDSVIPIRIDYSGNTYGGGATFAGAYKNIFFVMDMNYTLTELEGLNRSIRARNYAPRIGIAGEKVQGWIGAFLLNTDKQLATTVDVGGIPVDITPELSVSVPWNFIYGFRWAPTKSIEFVVEHGFSGRNQVIGAAAIRF